MQNLVKKIKDDRLLNIINCVGLGDQQGLSKVIKDFPEYDPSFIHLLCYSGKNTGLKRLYIQNNYDKFHQILDQGFPKELARAGNFESKMWEMILCDILSSLSNLKQKSKAGADFLLENEDIQVEAVAPNESVDENLRSIKPNYSESNMFELSGNIEDLERPILLRVFDRGFLEKAKRKSYNTKKPLIIAINSSKVVGLSSNDDYVLRRILFGLGFLTMTRDKDGKTHYGFQQNASLNKPEGEPFGMAVFRNSEYKHISGVIYTSQQSLGFIPGGYSWHNSGITFVKNPLAEYPINTEFPFLKEMICDEEKYQVIMPKKEFVSAIKLN